MTKEQIIEIIGFKKVGEDHSLRGVGVVLGYPVDAVVINGGRTLSLAFTTAEAINKKTCKKLQTALWDNQTLQDTVEVGHQEDDGVLNTFLININLYKEHELQELYGLTIQNLEKALADFPEIAPPTTCAICQEIGGDTLAYNNGALHFFHRTCFRREKEDMEQSFEEKVANPKLLAGLIGGFLGGVIGALPAFIALAFFHYFVWLLYALIPLGIFYGWKLAGGKLVKFTAVFTIVYTLITSAAVWLLSIALDHRHYWTEFGVYITIGEALDDVFYFIIHHTDEFVDIFLRDSLFALGSAVLGIWIAWRQITKTDEQAFQEAKANFDEAVYLSELQQ